MDEQQGTPPGWHQDPENEGQQRFWDGTAWTDRRRPSPPTGTNFSAAAQPTPASSGRWKTWQLAAAAALTFFIGIGVGGVGDVTTESAGDQEPQEVKTVTVPAPADDEPAAVAPPAQQGDTVTAGNFTFSDVQVSEDFVGDFEVRARAVNNGDDADSVGIKATIFSGGSVVGTATGVVNGWPSGETRTVELISVDEFQGWDEIEFQIEYEF